MKNKLILATGIAIGFVIGSKMGREPYEKLEATAKQYVDDPRVQEKAGQARETVSKAAKDAAGAVQEKATDTSTDSSVAGGDAEVHEAK